MKKLLYTVVTLALLASCNKDNDLPSYIDPGNTNANIGNKHSTSM